MEILITNDDSINAPGIKALIDCARDFGNITVVAPLLPQSGQSSAITVDKPLRLTPCEEYNGARLFTVNGTPVDCVKIALHVLFRNKYPDLLLSGINHGSNSGCAIVYSGTMGAVLEGCMNGIQSVGFSLLSHSLQADFSMCRPFVTELIAQTINHPLPTATCLNINMPAHIIPKGVKVCRATSGHWSEEYKTYNDPTGREFFMLAGNFVDAEPLATDTDEYYLRNGYISVVPVTTSMNDLKAIDSLKPIFEG
ncbi:MAG: 5'/3'-nucleotidase SurE [Muribaculaceae bacterium]|nr:5'/3'-nucleotidase SurE [Muribaculaceae bacterium]